LRQQQESTPFGSARRLTSIRRRADPGEERCSDGESEWTCTLPVVDFKVSDQVYTFEGSTASYPPAYEVGEQVGVRYDPTNPNAAQIDSLFERWVFPVIIIPAMILAALILNFFMIRAWRRGDGEVTTRRIRLKVAGANA
jgi:hypothetical protein